MNSAVLVGCKKIAPFRMFLSITSGVLFVSSITTLKAYKPCLCWIDSKYGLTVFKNLFLVSVVFCSNIKNLLVEAIYFLTVINNLLTLILSNADGLLCKVFCPNALIPCPGNCAIGFTFASYN